VALRAPFVTEREGYGCTAVALGTVPMLGPTQIVVLDNATFMGIIWASKHILCIFAQSNMVPAQ